MAYGRPVVNLGEKYIDGLRLAWASTTTITVAAGAARDSDNQADITLESAATVDISTNGANGLDQGSVANSTLYAVYVIGDSMRSSVSPGSGIATSNPVAAGLLSTNASTPLLPSGYDMYRRIGYVLTSGAGAILAFYQTGNGHDRWMHYDASIATDITAGASATYADVDCTGSVPLIDTIIELDCTFTPTGADDQLVVVPNGSTSANGLNRMSGSAAGVVKIGHMTCPCEGDSTLEYKVTGSAVALNVQGYLDSL